MTDLFDLKDKIALITGSTSGMGKAIAEALGLHGATVIVSSNEPEAVKNTVEAFQSKAISVLGIVCDMTQKTDIDNLHKQTMSSFGKIDILVNCVGIGEPGGLFTINHDTFPKIIGLNLQAAIYLTKIIVIK